MDDKVYTVSQITLSIKHAIIEQFPQKLKVTGEISNYKLHSSGHLYFSLKDDKSVIKCVMFNAVRLLSRSFKEGDKAVVTGAISIYEMQGVYQIYADSIEQTGLGDLYQEFLKIKEKLKKEGLFEESRKKPLPSYPTSVGIITSSTGAVIQDITNVLSRRAPYIKKYLYPTAVQGDSAHMTIIKGIEFLNFEIKPDLIIIARGGGSIEDLWPFNNEALARAISSSSIPIISAIGHETDFTIADFVSDLRAPTPSAAAEMAVKDIKDILFSIAKSGKMMNDSLMSEIKTKISSFEMLKKNFYIYSMHPINSARERLSKLRDDSEDILTAKTNSFSDLLRIYEISIHKSSPLRKFSDLSNKLSILKNGASVSLLTNLQKKRTDLKMLSGIIESMNPSYLLKKGYSIVYDEKNDIIKNYGSVEKNDTVKIAVSDGFIFTNVISTQEASDGSGKSGKENKGDRRDCRKS